MEYTPDKKYHPCQDCHCLATCDNCYLGDLRREVKNVEKLRHKDWHGAGILQLEHVAHEFENKRNE